MFISRTGSYLDLLAWLLMFILSWVGGWLIAANVFHLRHRERAVTGAACGMILWILLSNILALGLSIEVAFWASSVLIFGLGIVATFFSSERSWFSHRDLQAWPQILILLGLIGLFTSINFGLAILDDYANLPLVSTLATGDIPPHFYLNSDISLGYHFGLQLFAAGLVRIGGLFPWSAFDFSKALTTALCLVLAGLWYRRYTNKGLGVFIGVLVVLFGGGTRWILLFLPPGLIQILGNGLHMLGSATQSGSDLYTALINPWRIEGGGPIPFPFAFVNGIFAPMLGLGGNGSIPQMTMFLLLILARRRWQALAGLIFGFIIASLSLTTELLFVVVWFGILLAVLIRLWLYRPFARPLEWLWVLVPSAVLALISGGVITELSRQLLEPVKQASTGSVYLPPVALYWPPAFISAHLGFLSLTNPGQLLIGLAEVGPALLLAPFVTLRTGKYIRSRKLLLAGFTLMAAIGFCLPLFLRFVDRERELARVTSTSLSIWMLLGYPYIWQFLQRKKGRLKYVAAAGLAMVILGGVALFTPQMVAIAQPKMSYFIQEPDARMSKLYWNKLDPDAQILDLAYVYRPSVLFGRSAGRAYQTIYIPLPEFRNLVANPDALKIAQYGYRYVYFDRETWQSLSPEQRLTFQQKCVKQVAEQKTAMGDFRRLLDVQKCQTAP